MPVVSFVYERSAQHPIALGVALADSTRHPLGQSVCNKAPSQRMAIRSERHHDRGNGNQVDDRGVDGDRHAAGSPLDPRPEAAPPLAAADRFGPGRSFRRPWVGHPSVPAVQPKSGLVGQLQSRAGQRGSGRLADLGPGLSRWSGAPLFGRGLGTVAATGDTKILNGEATSAGVPIIFDDQYMNTLVSLGALGLIGVVWLVWGSAVKLGRSARRLPGGASRDLLTACTASSAGFGAAMLTYDAFSFVQSTLIFLIIAAVGLRARSLFEP